MNRFLSILLIFCLMLLHQECRVSNIEPEPPTTTTTNDVQVTMNKPPQLKEDVYVVDSNSIAEIVSLTETEFVYKGRLSLRSTKGGRLGSETCLRQGDKLIFSDNGLILEVAECPTDDSVNLPFGFGKVTVKHTGKFDFDITDLFLELNVYAKIDYTRTLKEDKITGTTVSQPDVDVSFGYIWNTTLTFALAIDLSDKRLKTFGGYLTNSNVFSLTTQNMNGSFKGTIFSKAVKLKEFPPVLVPIGPAIIPVTVKFSVGLDIEANGVIKAVGSLLTLTNKASVGFALKSTGISSAGENPSGDIRIGDPNVFEKTSSGLTMQVCLVPTVSLSILNIPGLPDAAKKKIRDKTPALIKPVVEKGIAKIDTFISKFPPLLTVSEGLRGCVKGTFVCNQDKPGITGTFVGIPFESIVFTARFDWVNYINKALGGKLFPAVISESYPLGLKELDLGTRVLALNCTEAPISTPPPGTCIPEKIETYLTSPVPVGRQGLSGFAGLADGAGSTPPVFTAGSVFRTIPTLYSSTRRAEDAIYIDKEFGELRLRFTYPNGKLNVEIKQYDEAGNLLLSEQSTWTEVTGQGTVFRICAAMSGSTNGKSYSNRVVIMGRLDITKKSISDFNYVLMVEGNNTPNYLLNGGSIRVFRAERGATNFSQFRLATDDQSHEGSNLSLMTY